MTEHNIQEALDEIESRTDVQLAKAYMELHLVKSEDSSHENKDKIAELSDNLADSIGENEEESVTVAGEVLKGLAEMEGEIDDPRTQNHVVVAMEELQLADIEI